MKPWLWIPSKTAHDMSPLFLRAYGLFRPFQTLTWKSLEWRGLEFPNPLGICGGVDKTGKSVKDWWTLGPGFVEVGTITPKPQSPNPGKIMDRDISQRALWNKMGFPSQGVENCRAELRKLKKPHLTPIFLNIGKNRETPQERAHEDYIYCIDKLIDFADAFVVNISSPNTKGLRELLEPPQFKAFLYPIKKHLRELCQARSLTPPPLLLKISPDLEDQSLQNILSVSLDLDIDGWILTNTTNQLRDKLNFPKEGGISGEPLAPLSKATLKKTMDYLKDKKGDKLVISAGGVMTPEDVFERLELGADLVQVYSALVYEGPFFFRKVADKARGI